MSKRVVCAVLFAVSCGAAGVARAHNQPPPIELWGAFLPGTQTCLRMISGAAHACFDKFLAIEQRCQDAALRGQPCDPAAVDAEDAAATGAVRDTLTNACAVGQLTELSYIGFFDADADLNNACVGQARAAIAAIYAPVRAGTSAPTAPACMSASATYGRKVMWFALQRETPIMERIATLQFDADQKKAAILQVERELSAARQRWITGLLGVCPEFESIYGRTAEGFLRTLKQRVDCVLSLTYVHSAVNCILQTCGDGIPEGDEQCDDGNSDDGDGCRNDCTAR